MTITGPSIGILGTGSYVPKEEVTSAELAARVGVTPEWIEHKTKIRARRFAAPDEAASDLAVRAAAEALAAAGVDAADLDYLIVATSTGDSPQPPTSYLVQRTLGADRAACFDVNVVCSGFVFALAVAQGLLATRPGCRALVVAADVYSRILDFSDRRTAVLFGDGAGAAVLGPVRPGYGVLGLELSSHGTLADLVGVRAGGSREPASADTLARGGHYFRMNGRAVTEFVIAEVPAAVGRLLHSAGVTPDAIKHLVPHQANGVLLDRLGPLCGLARARTHRTVTDYGNVGSASVAVSLDEGRRRGHLADGDLVILASFGGGMSIGAALLRWGI